MNEPRLRLLLDEHHPERLAVLLREAGVDTVALVHDRPDLVGRDDAAVLTAAAASGREVVTEDVSTFLRAGRAVPDQLVLHHRHRQREPLALALSEMPVNTVSRHRRR